MNKAIKTTEVEYLGDLARSGLGETEASCAGMFAVDDASALCRGFKRLPALVIPYADPQTGAPFTYGDGKPFLRIRYLKEPPARGFVAAKPVRYAQPPDSPVFAYFPVVDAFQWSDVLDDVDTSLVIVEGEKKALSGCLAELPTIGLGGVYNFLRDGELLPELQAIEWRSRDVYICFDSDAATNRDIQLAERRLCAELTRRDAKVFIARLPAADDGSKQGLDDYLKAFGADALFDLLTNSDRVEASRALVVEGTDVEIAEAVLRNLEDQYASRVVACEGEFWVYEGARWRPLPEHEVSKAVYRFDRLKCGKKGVIKISEGRTNSVKAIAYNVATDLGFFDDAPVGVNCRSGFIQFDDAGVPWLEPHNRDHRQRHILPGAWKPGAEWQGGGLLGRFLLGCFGDDDDLNDKVSLVSEICGVAALGAATRLTSPKAIVAFGPSASNGKSELLAMVSGLLPADAVCSVPPTKFSDERMLVKLAGRKLNACAELGTAQAIAADTFKSVVTGDQIMAKEVYKSSVFFRPCSLQLFATNSLPSFHGGFDRGVQRRLLVLSFNRTIPESEQTAEIGARISSDEADNLLAFAVEGASRALKSGHFTEPASSKESLSDWIFGADPVLAWMAGRTEYAAGERLTTKAAFSDFEFWCEENGFRKDRLPAANNFVQRILAQDGRLTKGRNRSERYLVGLRLLDRTEAKLTRKPGATA